MTAEKIRQSDFAAKHKLLPGEVKQLREKHLTEGTDFWSEGRAIFWTVEAADRVARILSGESFDEIQSEGFDAAMANVISHITPEAVEEMDAKTEKHETAFGTVSLLPYPTGEDAAHEVAAALAYARQKNSAHVVTAAQQADPLPEAEDEQPLAPAETPDNFLAYVLKPCKNKRFVYASYQDQKIAVAIHPRNQKKIIRKSIRVRAEKEGDIIRYTHVP